MKTTAYFDFVRTRPDRAKISDRWIEQAIAFPEHRATQAEGRIRLWIRVNEAHERWLRVVLLDDGETVHNAFFDRRFSP